MRISEVRDTMNYDCLSHENEWSAMGGGDITCKIIAWYKYGC